MPIWLTAVLGGVGKLMGAAGDWLEQLHQNSLEKAARQDQQNQDALQGQSDALHQVDRVNSALDSGGVPIASDPENRNR